jgi:phospholipid/cholesterol/gamma-HCH transport system permease protein
MIYFEIREQTLFLTDRFTKSTVPAIRSSLLLSIKKSQLIKIDGSGLLSLDSAGVALIDEVIELQNLSLTALINFSESNQNKIKIFTVIGLPADVSPTSDSLLLRLGDYLYEFLLRFFEMMVLTADIFYWSIVALWDRKGQRAGSFTQQVNLIGISALPIVGLLSFIIGLILSLQSAVQLKQFGADQFLANLLSFALVREMSPLITAIILAGRSGSAIASEVATMKVTEELDALKMMALNPIRYVIVPKFHAVTLVMSLLVTFSIIVGIIGGMIVAVSISDQSASAFIRTCFDIVKPWDLILSLIKSTIFSWQIVIIGAHYGLQVRGGAEGVGRATTQSVVAAIFGVIIMDALFSLLYLV